MIFMILSRLGAVNKGSVLIACIDSNSCFLKFKESCLSDLKPHDDMQYCRWGKIKLLYWILNTCWGKKVLICTQSRVILISCLIFFVPVHSMSNADRMSNLRN